MANVSKENIEWREWMSVHELKSGEFESYLASEGISFIDFWASWCGPCKAFAKVFEKVSKENKNINFLSVNIEKETELTETFEIRSVPHLIVIKNGIVIYSDSGALSASSLKELIEQAKNADVLSTQASK